MEQARPSNSGQRGCEGRHRLLLEPSQGQAVSTTFLVALLLATRLSVCPAAVGGWAWGLGTAGFVFSESYTSV